MGHIAYVFCTIFINTSYTDIDLRVYVVWENSWKMPTSKIRSHFQVMIKMHSKCVITDNLVIIFKSVPFSKVHELFFVHLIIKQIIKLYSACGAVGKNLTTEVTAAIPVLVRVLYWNLKSTHRVLSLFYSYIISWITKSFR